MKNGKNVMTKMINNYFIIYILQNKDRVRIITDDLSCGPKQEWIDKVKTTKAKKDLKENAQDNLNLNEGVTNMSVEKQNLQEGQVMLLENVRFHREETDNDPEFAKKLASSS